MGSRGQWATDLARALGNTAPAADMVNWLASWTLAENTAAAFNPLATTLDASGATTFNSAGVKNYASRQDGIDATVKTLGGDFLGYADIREGIRTNDWQRAQRGLSISPWGTNAGLVQSLNSHGDHREESLPAEGGSGGSSTASHTTFTTPQADQSSPNPIGKLPADLGKRVGYALLGVLCLTIAGVLAMRQYVPVRQIVETVAAAG